MKPRMRSKGQTALEGTFVLLFIFISINTMFLMALNQGTQITSTAIARSYAQGVALELTMEGTTTHLVRIDESPTGGFVLHVVTGGDCNAEVRDAFSAKLDSPSVTGANWNCKERLYGDTRFPLP